VGRRVDARSHYGCIGSRSYMGIITGIRGNAGLRMASSLAGQRDSALATDLAVAKSVAKSVALKFDLESIGSGRHLTARGLFARLLDVGQDLLFVWGHSAPKHILRIGSTRLNAPRL